MVRDQVGTATDVDMSTTTAQGHVSNARGMGIIFSLRKEGREERIIRLSRGRGIIPLTKGRGIIPLEDLGIIPSAKLDRKRRKKNHRDRDSE